LRANDGAEVMQLFAALTARAGSHPAGRAFESASSIAAMPDDGWLEQPVHPRAHVLVGYVAATDHEPERHVVVYTFDHVSRRRN
jgi:hypothetical protein